MDREDDEEQQALLPLFTPSLLDSIPIYSIVLDTYDLVVSRVDTSLKYEQLKSPQVHSFLIKPIAAALKEDLSPGTLYALMANMLQFSKEATLNAAMSGVMSTRAMICEIVAVKLLREYTDSDDLMNAMTYDFYPLANGNTENQMIPRWQRISTLELAIKAEAKRFLAHPVVINILEEIWNGSVMFQSSMHKLHRARFANEEQVVAAGYGRRGPGVRYAYEDASLFKLSRLRVPRYRHWLNFASFCGLLCLYVTVLYRQNKSFSTIEMVFWLWSLGFILDEIVGFSDAGFTLYVMSLWNWFDLIILILLCSYAVTLLASNIVVSHEAHLTRIAYDLLATIAIFLFPRLFSVLDGYEVFSYMVVSVRKMCVDLAVACLIIIIFSSGFWVAFTMAFARDVFSANKVAYDMLKILFGFTPTVWDTWQYYSVLGRVVLVFYLFITHFLIITILIAVLSNSFTAITSNAHEEHQYLFAVNTITMIKSESSSLFSYAPPLNLLEWVIRPLFYVMPLRNFLVLNRTVIKITHLPMLFLIFVYERLHLRITRLKAKRAQEAEAHRKQALKKSNIGGPAAGSNSGSGVNTGANNTTRAGMGSGGGATEQGDSNITTTITTPARKLRKSRRMKKKEPKNNKPPRPKVSNDDLLDEVFKRPYKGTLKSRPNIYLDDEFGSHNGGAFYSSNSFMHNNNNYNSGTNSTRKAPNSITQIFASEVNSDPEQHFDENHHLITNDEVESEEFEFDDDYDNDSIVPSAGAALFHSSSKAGRYRRRDRRGSDSTVHQVASGNTPLPNRTRLFSTTSSLLRHGAGGMLSLSPTRSTASVLDRHLWQMRQTSSSQPSSVRRRVRRRKIRTGYAKGNDDADEDRDDEMEGDDEDEDDDEYVEDDDDDLIDEEGKTIFKSGRGGAVSEEVQNMSRLIMRRMDTIESGFKNLELMLSRLPDVMSSDHSGRSVGGFNGINNNNDHNGNKGSMSSGTATET